MKFRKLAGVFTVAMITASMTACSGGGDTADTSAELTTRVVYMTNESTTEASDDKKEGLPVPEGMYLSEMTGEPIDEKLKDQRPVAVMVDNEMYALDHYEIAEADVVYEIMNSTANDRITRLMVLVKDWGKIERLGSIRSTRPTNIMLYPEWNAVLCHDGGPAVHINAYFDNDWTPHFNGFSRVNNGKSYEFTEYIVSGDLDSYFSSSGVSPEYDEHRPEDESHFEFTPYGTTIDLEKDYGEAVDAELVDLSGAFPHNASQLKYNKETETYDYYEYGDPHKDGEDGEILSFKNVILQDITFNELDDNGYLMYHVTTTEYKKGYYITNGKAIEIFWTNPEWLDHTRYYVYDENGMMEELVINTGKTYIGLIPDDSWDTVKFE